jgi:hypothetical protein
MRKIITITMLASTALLVSACGKSENASTTDTNTMVSDMNASDALEGTVNDMMTNIDGAMGSDNAMALNEASAANGATAAGATEAADNMANMTNAM